MCAPEGEKEVALVNELDKFYGPSWAYLQFLWPLESLVAHRALELPLAFVTVNGRKRYIYIDIYFE